jgi:ubiquinone biosynthesis protein
MSGAAPSRDLRESGLKVIRGGPIDPARLRRLLIRLGPMFVKIGQFLALRPDVLPQEYCDELLQLVDQAEPEPWENMRATIERELGAPVETLFRTIRTVPLAAGSIAQVHRATLHDGTRVVVKVQRTNLAARVTKDLARVRWLARILDWSGISPFTSPDEVVAELDRWLHQELDFTRELRNQQRMYDALKSESIVRVPRAYPELSTSKIVTSEYLSGLPFSRVLRLMRDSGPGVLARLGFDQEILAEDLVETTLFQIFRLRFFHADLHPGNLIAMRGNVVGLVDFGLTDVLDPSVERRQADFLSAIYVEDVTGMYRAVSQIFIEGPDTNPEAFRRDFFNETSRWIAEKSDDARAVRARSSTASYMISVMRLARVHGMRLPTSVLALYRTLLTAETVAHQMESSVTLGGVAKGFFRSLQIEQAIDSFEPGRVIAWLMQLNDLLRSGPGNLQQVLSDVADGRFILPVRTLDSEQSRRASNQRTRLLTLAVLSLGISLLLSRGGLSVFGVSLEPLLWAALAADAMAMTWLWRRLE